MQHPEFLSCLQAAERLGVTERRVRVLAEAGRLKGAFRVGRAWVLPVESVDNFQPQPHGVRLGRKARKQPPTE